MRSILERRPLYLCVETTNICNARCVFCAYPKMARPKQVMAPKLFAKIVEDYVDMGGGAIALTPIVGDVLIDPHFVDRLRLLRSRPEITDVSFTTNGIASDRFSEGDQRLILESSDCISFSIGGLDANSYGRMFGVDRFEKVCKAIESVCSIKSRWKLPLGIHLLFRVDRPIDALMSDPDMARFRREEITAISGINSFGNWGGMVGQEDLPPGASVVEAEASPEAVLSVKRHACFVYYLAPEVTSSGLVSACGCMNAEAKELILGDVRTQHLRDIWNGPAFRKLRASFGTDSLPEICKKCTYYQDGEEFIRNPALSRFEVGDNPWEVIRKHSVAEPGALLSETVKRLVGQGHRRIALYGAGSFTRTGLASKSFAEEALRSVVAVIDDNEDLVGKGVANLPIVSQTHATSLGIDAVVLSSDRYIRRMWEASQPLREAGVKVVPAGGVTSMLEG
ncbi:MAG: radical SAM protein [Planctomycetes bacterium]|nr:radical SAM protein [Planctomycetota bacterium]